MDQEYCCLNRDKDYDINGFKCDVSDSACKEVMNKYCGKDFTLNGITYFNLFGKKCRKFGKANKGVLDDLYKKICKKPENKYRGECGCINFDPELMEEIDRLKMGDYHCISKKCTDSNLAYKTAQQRDSECKITNCIMANNLLQISGDVDEIELEQKCGNQLQEEEKEKKQEFNLNEISEIIYISFTFIIIVIILLK